ncbi:ferredoxin [Streptococcus marmotae]|uniref:ferredoxin n=1 Tax=Streptococcus marmotae TaxID=1825069 RepID=UPI00082FA9B6|nr:ferredoxin [Streptococcus marmotae]
MKIKLYPEKCIACGLCQTYSDIFDYDDEGIVLLAHTDEDSAIYPDEPAILQAVKSCPTKAITSD